MEKLLKKIEDTLNSKLPFVFYRKPEEENVYGFFQDNDTLHFIEDFSESGFVFAPFDTNQKAILIPGKNAITYTIDASLDFKKGSQWSPADTSAIERNTHIDLVTKGIQEIQRGKIHKVVLSRKQSIQPIHKKPSAIFFELLSSYPTAMVYIWYHPRIGLWMGATPETLLQADNRTFKTMSLAGTQIDTGVMTTIWGSKEKEEQALVTQEIVDRLKTITSTIKVGEVQTHSAGNLLHLKTDIQGTLDTTVDLKVIIQALHPTPAVCGLPKARAKDFILQHEQYKRTFYTGFLGELHLKKEHSRSTTRRNTENLAYKTIKSKTHLFVNLRCMELLKDTAHLYVGGGITKSSDPNAEWEETVSKLTTIGKVLD